MPPLAQAKIAARKACERSVSSMTAVFDAIVQRVARGSVRFHPDCVDAMVGPPSAGHVPELSPLWTMFRNDWKWRTGGAETHDDED